LVGSINAVDGAAGDSGIDYTTQNTLFAWFVPHHQSKAAGALVARGLPPCGAPFWHHVMESIADQLASVLARPGSSTGFKHASTWCVAVEILQSCTRVRPTQDGRWQAPPATSLDQARFTTNNITVDRCRHRCSNIVMQ
jgi:hypothetical protein